MGVYKGSDAASPWGASSERNYAGFSSAPVSKYYDEYKTTDGITTCNNMICYGHGLSETSRWYGDYSYFVNATYPWMLRGGSYIERASAGYFLLMVKEEWHISVIPSV